jgi:HSP20 family protein
VSGSAGRETNRMAAVTRMLPIRVYEAGQKVMIAAPMPGLTPQDISVTVDGERVSIRGAERGPHQHGVHLVEAGWTVGPYVRDVHLPGPVTAALTNVTYGNGVLVVAMPRTQSEEPGAAEIRLETIAPTRGQRVGHFGRVPKRTTTAEHRRAKNAQQGSPHYRVRPLTSSRPGATARLRG